MKPRTSLKRAIFDSGLTQRSIAAAVGLREDQLSRIVNGLVCDEDTQADIAAVLGRDEADLFPVTGDLGEAA